MLFIFISYLFYFFIITVLLEFTQANSISIFVLVNLNLFSKLLYNSYIYYQYMDNFIKNQYENCSHDIEKVFISNCFFTITGVILLFLLKRYRNVLLFDLFFQIYNFCIIIYLKYKYKQEYSVDEINPISTLKTQQYI